MIEITLEEKKKNLEEYFSSIYFETSLLPCEVVLIHSNEPYQPRPMNEYSNLELVDRDVKTRWLRTGIEPYIKDALARLPIWSLYPPATATTYLACRLKASTWRSYQTAWDRIWVGAQGLNIKIWEHFLQDYRYILTALALETSLPIGVRNTIRAVTKIILGPLCSKDDVPDVLIAKVRVPANKSTPNKYNQAEWANIAPIWSWMKATYTSSDEIIIRNRAIVLLKFDIARRQDDISKIFRQYIEWNATLEGIKGIYVRIACSKEDKSRALGPRIFIPRYCNPEICTVTALERYRNITENDQPLSTATISLITGGFWNQAETPLFMWTGKHRHRHLVPATIANICVKVLTQCGFELQSCQGDPTAHVTRGAAASFMISAGCSRKRTLTHMGVTEKNFERFYWRPLPVSFFYNVTELTDDAHPCFWLRRYETHNMVITGCDLVQKGQSGVMDAA